MCAHFGGQLAHLKLHREALTPRQVQALAQARPDFGLIVFHEVGGHWPWQVKQWRGLQEPQDPWTLPRGKAAFSKPMAKTLELSQPLVASGADTWTLSRWRLAEAPRVAADGKEISGANYSDESWHAATVPGTVLTTLIDRGVYPDYDYGLNNMAIPESLARQDYWYRTRFRRARRHSRAGSSRSLSRASITPPRSGSTASSLGTIRGAFIRGVFDVTSRIAPASAT